MSANTTKEKIVELGRSYIQQIGYHSFNYKQIASELNIKNAAIHHYYPSKEDLGVAVIEKDHQDFMTMIQQVEKSTPTEKIDAFLNNYGKYFTDGEKLCVIGTFGSSYHDVPERIQRAATNYLDLMITWLTDTFKAGLASGEFKFEGTAEEMASLWAATLPGSLQIGRIRGLSYFNQLLNGLRNSLKATKT